MSDSPPGSTPPREIPGVGEPGGPFFDLGKTAVLIDGAFFVRRLPGLLGGRPTAAVAADAVERLAREHLLAGRRDPDRQLYRVFFYDCPPLGNKFQRPSGVGAAVWTVSAPRSSGGTVRPVIPEVAAARCA